MDERCLCGNLFGEHYNGRCPEEAEDDPNYDGAPYCSDCGARERKYCNCHPRAEEV
jgi:hypothetical protein